MPESWKGFPSLLLPLNKAQKRGLILIWQSKSAEMTKGMGLSNTSTHTSLWQVSHFICPIGDRHSAQRCLAWNRHREVLLGTEPVFLSENLFEFFFSYFMCFISITLLMDWLQKFKSQLHCCSAFPMMISFKYDALIILLICCSGSVSFRESHFLPWRLGLFTSNPFDTFCFCADTLLNCRCQVYS